jgi:hypothetical protein
MCRGQVAQRHVPDDEGRAMTSKTSGAAKKGDKTPRHAEHNARGTKKNPYSKQDTKAALLARMKAAAEARKTTD